MKKIFALLLIISVFVFGCNEYQVPEENQTAPAQNSTNDLDVEKNQSETPKQDENSECTVDSDCVAAGCSGQLCVPKDKAGDIMTTCEFKPEYECLKLTSCSCIEGSCSWQKNQEYNTCMEDT